MGYEQWTLKRYENALQSFKRSHHLDSKDARPLIMIGQIYQAQGKLEDAIESFKQAGRVEPKNATAFFLLGIAFDKLDDYESAAASYKKSILANPDLEKSSLARTYVNLGGAQLRKGDRMDALSSFEKAIELNPSEYEIYSQLMVIFIRAEHAKDGLDFMTEVVKKNPRNALAYLALGGFYSQSASFDLAIVNWKKALEINPKLSQARYVMGVYYAAMGDKEGAMEQYRALEEFDLETAKQLLGKINP
ncbi:MAG: tetratricopeptide repeat protein [Elusimicrobia bacterium]|nr:tetratricopeptide repeat protein [Elusimicrobiota bacterium]